MTILQEAQGDQGKTWKTINDIMGRQKKASYFPDTLILNNDLVTSNKQEICNEMNRFFVEVGPALAKRIPDNKTNPVSLIRQASPRQSLFLTPVTEEQVLRKLRDLNTKKSHGPDGLHPRFLRDTAPFIYKSLTHIINTSFQTGYVPESMKTARVVPLHKTGDRKKPNNYRPISILSTFTKIIEGFVHDKIFSFLTRLDIWSSDQYGFRKGRSTKGALIRFIDELQRKLDTGHAAGAVYCDLSKAFDTVSPSILLQKLNYYGIRGVALTWFENYFKDRKQYVQDGQTSSILYNVTCGIPQGSNLGPLLFSVYVNDMTDNLETTKAILFADDTTTYNFDKNGNHLTQILNNDLNRLEHWFETNKLTLNANKTYACEFKDRKQDQIGDICIRNMVVEKRDSVKYLGIHVDNKLNWKSHISYITNKVCQVIGVLNRIRGCLTKSALKSIYYSLIHSRISYCIEIWGTAYPTALKPLIKAQKKAIRIISGASSRSHTEPLFRELNIRPLSLEIEFKRALLAYDMNRNQTTYGVDIVQNLVNHGYTTRNAKSKNIQVPRKQTKRFGTESLHYLLTKAYNELPEDIKSSTLPTQKIKLRLKQHYNRKI